MKATIYRVLAVAALVFAAGTGSAGAQSWDPTQSRAYRYTPWVDYVYPKMDAAVRYAPYATPFLPPNVGAGVTVFGNGWQAGKGVQQRFDTGGFIYKRYFNNPGRRR